MIAEIKNVNHHPTHTKYQSCKIITIITIMQPNSTPPIGPHDEMQPNSTPPIGPYDEMQPNSTPPIGPYDEMQPNSTPPIGPYDEMQPNSTPPPGPYDEIAERREQALFRMVTENAELAHECRPQHPCMGAPRMKRGKETDEECSQKSEYGKKHSRHEKKSRRPNCTRSRYSPKQ